MTSQILAAQRNMILEAIINEPSPEMGWSEKMGWEKARMTFYQIVLQERFEPKERQ